MPLFVIAFYDYPSADDFSMGAAAHLAYVQTGHLWAAIAQGFYMAWYDYMNWMGYFSATFFLSLPPCIVDERQYPLGPILLIGFLILSVFILFRTLLTRMLQVNLHITDCISALTCFLMIQCLPFGLSRVESFYWYCSGANYTLMFSFGLLWSSLLLISEDSGATSGNRCRPLLRTILACILGFVVGGGNYMTALCCAMLATLVIFHTIIIQKRKPVFFRLCLILPCLFQLTGFAISCLAPGNSVRGSEVSGYSAVKTVLIALYYVLSYCISQWTTWAVLLLLICLTPFLWIAAKQTSFSFRYPGIIVILAWGFAGANLAPPLYALGNIEAGRIQGLFWMQYILLLVLTEGYLVGWLQRQLVQRISGETSSAFSRQTSLALLLLALFFLFGAALQTKVDPHYFTAGSAVTDLISGSAVRYAAQNAERRRMLTDPAAEQVVLPPYTDRPALLFFSDITNDPSDWTNQALARYYGKKSVRIP